MSAPVRKFTEIHSCREGRRSIGVWQPEITILVNVELHLQECPGRFTR